VSEAQVVFFGIGNHAETVFESLNRKFAPVAYGDGLKDNQGTRFRGMLVLSLEQAEVRHPGCQYYLTVDPWAKPYFTEFLIAGGVDRSRVINYEKYKEYSSCWLLENNMRYIYSSNLHSLGLFFCCSDFGKNKSPGVPLLRGAHDETMHSYIELRDRIIDGLSNPSDTQNPCHGCRGIAKGLWPIDRHIRCVSLGFRSICNFKCSYCKAPVGVPPATDVEELLPLLRFMREHRHIDTDTQMQISAGEISVHPLRGKILEELQDYPCVIFTNAGVYNDQIGKMLSMGRSELYPSIDAGTRSTFAKIKGVDLFDGVCENLARYSSDGFVHLKYIVLPGLNDNEADMDGFICLCRRLGIRAVDISRDDADRKAFSVHTINTVAKMIRGLQELGVNVAVPDHYFGAVPEDKKRIVEKLIDSKCALGEHSSAPAAPV